MLRVHRRFRPIAVAIALLAVGCSFLDSDPQPSATTAPTTTAPTTSTTAPVEPPVVEVLDAGEEPRRLLRYEVTPGRTELFITTGSTIRQEGASASPIEIVTPDITHVVELTIGEPTAAGVPLELEIRSAHLRGDGLSDVQIRQLDESLEQLAGLTGTGRFSADGRLREFRWQDLDLADDTVRGGIEAIATQMPGLIAPLPGAAVGPGARWRATSTIVLDETPVAVTTTYSLKNVLGTFASYSSVSETTVEGRDLPALSDGSGVELLRSTTTALTDGTLDFGGLLANTTAAAVAEQQIRIHRADGPRDVDQRIETHVSILTAP